MRFLLLTASLTMAEADTRHRARSSRLVRHELSSLAHPNNATDAPPNSLLCSRRIGLLDATLRKSRGRTLELEQRLRAQLQMALTSAASAALDLRIATTLTTWSKQSKSAFLWRTSPRVERL